MTGCRPCATRNADVEAITRLVELHLRFHTYKMGWTDSAVRRYVRDAGDLLDELNVLTRCDCTTRNEQKAALLARRMDELEARIDELAAEEELKAIRPELDGNQVMARLGLRPGPAVGQAMAFLLELRLEEGVLGEDEAGRRLDAWWAHAPARPDRARVGRTDPAGRAWTALTPPLDAELLGPHHERGRARGRRAGRPGGARP